jgi:hypothetical protein
MASYKFRNTEHHMPVGNSLDHLPAEPLAEFHNPPLMAGWTKMPSFARRSQQELVAEVLAPDKSASRRYVFATLGYTKPNLAPICVHYVDP